MTVVPRVSSMTLVASVVFSSVGTKRATKAETKPALIIIVAYLRESHGYDLSRSAFSRVARAAVGQSVLRRRASAATVRHPRRQRMFGLPSRSP
jgi:hypothetical protein